MTTPTPRYVVRCFECDKYHPADYSHESQWGQGPIYVVYCDDGLADYYTSEVVEEVK